MWQQSPSIDFDEFDVEALRKRLQKMNDERLVKFGKAIRF
jgi:hypothetical protein